MPEEEDFLFSFLVIGMVPLFFSVEDFVSELSIVLFKGSSDKGFLSSKSLGVGLSVSVFLFSELFFYVYLYIIKNK